MADEKAVAAAVKTMDGSASGTANEALTVSAPYDVKGPDAPQTEETPPATEAPAEEEARAEEKESPETPEAPLTPPKHDEAKEELAKKNLNFDDFNTEFMANGELSEASYATLEKAGIPKAVVDAYIEGQTVRMNAFISEVKAIAGGEEQYTSMIEWADKALPQEDKDAFNRVMESGDRPLIKMAVAGLKVAHAAEEGSAPRLVSGKSPSAQGTQEAFTSPDEMIKAMRDPRYGKDSAYTREVERKTSGAKFF